MSRNFDLIQVVRKIADMCCNIQKRNFLGGYFAILFA